jgi:hypothetical protein
MWCCFEFDRCLNLEPTSVITQLKGPDKLCSHTQMSLSEECGKSEGEVFQDMLQVMLLNVKFL